MSIKDLLKKLFKNKGSEIPEDNGPKPIKEYVDIEIMDRSIVTPKDVYVLTGVKMFEDKCQFEFNTAIEGEDGFLKCVKHSFCAPYTPGQTKIDLIVDDKKFTWDEEETYFRWIPNEEPLLERSFNKWVNYYSNGELRINKEYADNNLTKEAIEYAFFKCDDYYSWNVWDGSYATVMFEIPSVFDEEKENAFFEYFAADIHKAIRDLGYVNKYFQQLIDNMVDTNIYKEYEKNVERVLWEP